MNWYLIEFSLPSIYFNFDTHQHGKISLAPRYPIEIQLVEGEAIYEWKYSKKNASVSYQSRTAITVLILVIVGTTGHSI